MTNSKTNKTDNSQSKHLGKENSENLSSSLSEGLRPGENRTSYLTRKDFGAVLEYEKKAFKGKVNLTRHEKETVIQQLGKLEQETNTHVECVMGYLVALDNSSVDIKQVDYSLNWLEVVDPALGQLFREEVFLKQKKRYDLDKSEAQALENKILNKEKRENKVLKQECTMVSENSFLVHGNKGLEISKYFLGGLLFFYLVNQMYKKFYKSKNKKKD